MSNSYDITDLETKGFLVIRNFLQDAEIQPLLHDYHKQLSNNNHINIKNYSLLKAGEHGLTDKIKTIVELINSCTNISIDLVGPSGMYFDTNLVDTSWHQDHESYYTWQTGYHQMNFWMPLIKPCESQSGLKVIPMDRLRIQMGDLFDQLILDKGAKRFVTSDNITHVFDDEQGTEFDLPFSLDDFAETPELAAGDVLLIRGDVIHATQDTTTHRVTLSVRAVDGTRVIQREKFFNQCSMKKFVLNANSQGTKRIVDQFELGKDSLVIHDLFRGRI